MGGCPLGASPLGGWPLGGCPLDASPLDGCPLGISPLDGCTLEDESLEGVSLPVPTPLSFPYPPLFPYTSIGTKETSIANISVNIHNRFTSSAPSYLLHCIRSSSTRVNYHNASMYNWLTQLQALMRHMIFNSVNSTIFNPDNLISILRNLQIVGND